MSAEIEVSTPKWAPVGAKINLAFKRSWERRQEEFLEAVDVPEDDLAQRIGDDAAFSHLFVSAAEAGVRTGDDVYTDLLARLVRTAYYDDARIDETTYLANIVVQLDPADLRLLLAMRERAPGEYYSHNQRDKGWTRSQMTTVLGVPQYVASYISKRLEGRELIAHGGTTVGANTFVLTEFASELLKYCDNVAGFDDPSGAGTSS